MKMTYADMLGVVQAALKDLRDMNERNNTTIAGLRRNGPWRFITVRQGQLLLATIQEGERDLRETTGVKELAQKQAWTVWEMLANEY